MAVLLDVKGLSKSYQRAGKLFYAANDVELRMEAGDFVCITGRSGSGKSTLLNLITGLLRPDAGSVFFEGKDLTQLGDGELSRVRGTRIGYIPQGQSALYSLSVLDNVKLPLFLQGDREQAALRCERARSLLARTGIERLADENPRNLSGGELRRVAIARSLIHDPAILVADEPTADLDPETTAIALRLFGEINRQGTAIIMVTHDEEIAKFAKQQYRMDAGKLSEKFLF